MPVKTLDQEYFRSMEVHRLAQELLGQILCTKIEGIVCKGTIVETEAYEAPEDKASHAFNSKRTKRTETMFGEGGRSYVYLIYGMHAMMNIVTGPIDSAHAILIRALAPISGMAAMQARQGTVKKPHLLATGPGVLCKAMGITTADNNLPLYQSSSKIWIEKGTKILAGEIISGPRVGIAYAKEYANKPWRYYIKNHASVSKPLTVQYD